MKREVFVHTSFFLSFFILFSLVRGWLKLGSWPFWLGGLAGSFLPLLDHLVYIFFLSPQELSSQRVVYFFRNRNFTGALRFLIETRGERTNLIFRSNTFLIVISILAVWILSSSASLIGAGLVLGTVIYLLVDRALAALYHRSS
jgi:O-antigen/teichoic acid export membrane protein